MTVPDSNQRERYHHGDLRNALVQAGVELGREGGPHAIVLREVARRVGVSANAAYRHFHDLPDLVCAVQSHALQALADAMTLEVAKLGDNAGPVERLCAVGRGYVRFALAEPGLFATAFTEAEKSPELFGEDEPPDSAWNQLHATLDAMVEAGLLADADREAAALHAWATVHGLSMLLLGPMAAITDAERDDLIDSTLDLVVRGLRIRP